MAWKAVTGGDVRGGAAIAVDGTDIHVGSYDRHLYAIAPTCQILWRIAAAERIHGTPTVATNGVVLVGAQDERLYAVAADGKLLWTFAVDGDLDSTPTITADGTIYLAGDDGVLRALQ